MEDAAEAFDVVLHKGVVGEVYNLGTSKELSTLQVTDSICAHFGLDAAAGTEFVADRLYNDRRYFISSAKLNALGWDVRTPWEEGLTKTISWYKQHVLEGKYWPHYEVALIAHPFGGKSMDDADAEAAVQH